ncbi:hypothetical protein MHTCC0001_26040 [Flavobacteriaceae bacterium MHTCC 0001]
MIKKAKQQLLKSIKNKRLNVFLLFLLSSFLILIFTKLSKEYTNTISFNVKHINVPLDKVILDDSTHQLKITLKTHGFRWLNYYLTQPEITVDFSEEVYVQKRRYIYTKSPEVLNEKKQFQNQVKILNITPDTLIFKFDTNSIKKIPVIPHTEITFAPGFDVLNAYTSNPDSITVIGPKETVDSIRLVSTEKVILEKVKTNISQQVNLMLPVYDTNLKFSNHKVELIAKVEKFTEGTLEIPIQIVNLPKGVSLNFFPKKLKVSYYTSLSDFDNITSNDFKVICDFKKVGNSESSMIPELVKSPKHVKYVKLSQQHIEFIISK